MCEDGQTTGKTIASHVPSGPPPTMKAADSRPRVVPPSIAAAPTAEYAGRLGCIGQPSMLVAPRERRTHLKEGVREEGHEGQEKRL